MALTTSDKITLTKYPALPSKCAACLRGSDGSLEFVDFQVSFDWEGAVVICTDCWKTAAELIQYVSADEIAPLVMDIQELQSTVERLTHERDTVQSALDSLLAVRPDLVHHNSGVDESKAEGSESDSGQPEIDFEGSGQDDPQPSKPTTERRSKNVSQSRINL